MVFGWCVLNSDLSKHWLPPVAPDRQRFLNRSPLYSHASFDIRLRGVAAAAGR